MVYSREPMDIHQFEGRKRDHIRHALDPAHQAVGLGGFDRIRLVHEALPELDFHEVRLDSTCLGKPAPTPFYVAGMTAGHADAAELNRRLAVVCARRGWAMGIGSQRRDLESQSPSVDQWKKIRAEAPELVLFGNLGLSQLASTSVDAIRRLVDAIQAQALAIHANALQECMQPEGTPNFNGGLQKLRDLCRTLGVPIVLKETGCGFSARTLARLAETGLAAVDVSGLGGTHWGRIEGARAQGQDPMREEAARTFAGWGESTVDSILAARQSLPKTEIWASGGIRSGLDAAKAIALGAHRVGYAQPALEAAMKGPESLDAWMARQEYELKTALFCTGNVSPEELRQREGTWIASVN